MEAQCDDRAVTSVLSHIDGAQNLYHRLVLVVGAGGSGKTATLAAVSQRTNSPVLNLNLELSRGLLDLTARQRALQAGRILDDLIGRDRTLVLLDNTELLFAPTLKQDPLALLQRTSRNQTIVASWNGTVDDGYLSYAEPDHPEYWRYPKDDLVIVLPEPVS